VLLALSGALGCVTAEGTVATHAVPAFANSAMDGFALRADDTLDAPVSLRVVATTLAGMAPAELGPGEAVRIMTGAALPSGADAVCMVEHSAPGTGADDVIVTRRIEKGTFVRLPGDDLRAGQVVVPAGTTIRPGHLGVLASLGLDTVLAHPRPRVGVLSTGDELTDAPGPDP
jgi:molybdopterin molybdotransferase